MRIAIDGLMLCDDCLLCACNGDTSGVPDERVDAVERGVAELGPHLVPNFDSETGRGIHEFSRSQCDACGERGHGSRHEFAVLADDLRTRS